MDFGFDDFGDLCGLIRLVGDLCALIRLAVLGGVDFGCFVDLGWCTW